MAGDYFYFLHPVHVHVTVLQDYLILPNET